MAEPGPVVDLAKKVGDTDRRHTRIEPHKRGFCFLGRDLL